MAGSSSDSDSEMKVVGTMTAEEGDARREQMTKLQSAIDSNNIKYLGDNLGSLSAFVDLTFDNRTSPIYLAVRTGNLDVLKMLIKARFGVDVGIKSPLYHASTFGNAEVVKMLLDAGADPNKAKRGDGYTPLYVASLNGHTKVVEMLLGARADPNKATTDTGKTPLITASTNGRAEVVEMLLGAGADPNKATTDTSDTPLFGASSNGHTKVVKILLEAGADPDKATTDTGVTSLFIASQEGYAEVVKILLGAGADKDKATTDDGQTPVYAASRSGHAEVAKILLDAGADPDKATTDIGATPLFIASQQSNTEVVKVLLEAGADKDKATETNATPLSAASFRGYAEVVKILLDAGADPDKARTDLPQGQNVTPLFLASQDGHPEVVKMLLGAGANPNKARATDNMTPLGWACQRADANMVEMLLDANADPNIAKTNNGTTPLIFSVLRASDDEALAVIQLLAMAGADILQVDTDNKTAAMRAQDRNLPKTVAWLNTVANLNQVQIIVALGREDVLRKILRRGEIDLFSPRAQGTSSITELAAVTGDSMLRLVTKAKLKWSPVRHGLFHPAHRSTVYCILLVAWRAPRRLGLRQNWITAIPTEIWFIIIEWLGRVGWPNEGRQALLQFPSPGSVNVRASTDFSDPNNLGRIGVANVLPGEYLFSPDVAAEFEDFMVYAKDQRRRIDTTPTLKNAKTLRRAMDDIIEAANKIESGIRSRDKEKRKLRYECEETIKILQTVNGFTKKMQGVFLEEHLVVEDLMGV